MRSFSHSSIKTYEDCPFKYKLTRIDKLQEPTGDAAQRGKDIHTTFENAIDLQQKLGDAFTYWDDYIAELILKGAKSEVQFAITKDWSRTDFLAANAWLRGIYDVLWIDGSSAHVLDWKTGKERDYGDQLQLYATIIMSEHPEVDVVTTEICYIDANKRHNSDTFTRNDYTKLKQWVTWRIAKIESDDIFAPKPSNNCRWCHFRKNNGGPCQW
jgi:CRISPR/Cas system-associated exonuclease Cas4 (RecB family)